jgi:hypothetical protein
MCACVSCVSCDARTIAFGDRAVPLFVTGTSSSRGSRKCGTLTLLLRVGPPVDEKNEKSKKTIKAKTAEYMARAEKLKQFLDKKEKPQAEGGG